MFDAEPDALGAGHGAEGRCFRRSKLSAQGLEQNAIGENGAKALAAASWPNFRSSWHPKLVAWSFCGCQALQQNHSLIKLRLRGNPLQARDSDGLNRGT